MSSKSYIFILLLSSISSGAQTWSSINSGVDGAVRYLFNDSINDVLYVSGNFVHADNLQVNQIAKWNGLSWDTLGHGMYVGGSAYDVTSWGNSIFVSGNVLNDLSHFLGRWNGANWDTAGLSIDGAIGSFKVNNGDLYIGGDFQNANYLPAKFLAKYNTNGWTTFPTSTFGGGGIFALEIFNNELFCGGNFYDTLSGINRLAKWDGNTFISVGSGIVGSSAGVSSLAVYRNELYIGGYFTTSMGNAANYIMKWDGANLSPVGTGTNSTVRCMTVFNDELYVGGDFTTAGGISASRLAKWNGLTWNSVSPALVYGSIFDLTFYNDDLYIGGSFHNIDSLPIRYIARYSLGNFVLEQNDMKITIFPNPTSGKFIVKYPSNNQSKVMLVISDLLGRKLKEYNLNNSDGSYTFDLSEFENGIYLVSQIRDGIYSTAKIIKNE